MHELSLGIEKWQNGLCYTGEFYYGKKHGYGKYDWTDGSRYEGQWYENNLHGFVIKELTLGNLLFHRRALLCR